MKILLTIMICLAGVPLWAQLYSYVSPEGRLVITDRPIKRDGYKLKDTFVPKRKREELAAAAERAASDRGGHQGQMLTRSQLAGFVDPIAKAMQVDPDLVKAVVEVESGRVIAAKSHKGAMGLMQLIPETAERFGVSNAWDPRQNIQGGIRYLKYLLSYFEGDVDLVLAAYNAGENAVDRHGGIPPYNETRRYVKKVRMLYKERTHPFDEKVKHRSTLITRARADRPVKSIARAE